MAESDREEQNSSDQTQNSYGAFVDGTSNPIVGTCYLCSNPIYATDETKDYRRHRVRGTTRHYTVHAVCYQKMLERQEAIRKEQAAAERRSKKRRRIFIGVAVAIVIILIILLVVFTL